MNRERILSHKASQKLSMADLENVSAAGTTSYMTANGSYSRVGGFDSTVDITIDF
jgi:hypothetical protein